MVHYPIAKQEIPDHLRPKWDFYDHRADGADALIMVWAMKGAEKGKEFNHKEVPPNMLLAHVKMNVCQSAPFSLQEKKLVPIILHHGCAARGIDISQIAREYASHGYIVFSPDSQDGCCTYYEKQNGEAVVFDPDQIP